MFQLIILERFVTCVGSTGLLRVDHFRGCSVAVLSVPHHAACTPFVPASTSSGLPEASTCAFTAVDMAVSLLHTCMFPKW